MSDHKEHHSNGHHKEYSLQAYIVLALLAGLYLWLTYGNNPAVFSVASEQFDLTKSDIRMIPITSLVFVVFWLLMQKVFFNPLLQVIEERESKTTGAKSHADGLLQEAQKLQAEYEDKTTNAQILGAKSKLNLISEARNKAQNLQEETQNQITSKLNQGRQENLKEAQLLKDSLMAKSSELVEEATKKIISVPASLIQMLVFSIIFFAFANESYAAGDGHAVSISHLTWYVINFTLFVGMVFYLIKKPFVKFWNNRSQSIAEAVNRGELELKLAREKLTESQNKLAQLTAERLQEIENAIKKEGELEAKAILEQSNLQKEQMLKQSEQTLIAEKNSASSDVRKQVAEHVMKLVEEKVKTSFDASKDQERRNQAVSGFKSILS